MTFNDNGTLNYNSTAPGSPPRIGSGEWSVIRESGKDLIINRKIGPTPAETTITFTDDDNIVVKAVQGGVTRTTNMSRRG